jgi:glycosyltransferase involved in cell wall biosynthesis
MIGSRGLGTSYGGIERVLDAVCPELVALGHEVDVFAAAMSTSSELPGLKVVRVPCVRGKHSETISRSVLSLSRAVGRYDVVHFHAIGPGILSVATQLLGQPAVVTIHGLDQRRDKWGVVAKSCLSLAEDIIVKCADRVTVVSEDLRRHFLERHDLRTSYIPNGLPTVAQVPRGPVLASLGLLKRRYIFFASRLTVEKGCHDLIEAHAGLDNDVALVIAGKALQPDYEAHLRQLAGRDVMFVGHRSGRELQELYSNAALFVLPSYLEGMSMALLEAMAYGVPIVVSDIPENKRVVGNDAICFPVHDVRALAEALRLALAQRSDTTRHTAKWPTWANIAKQYGDVYHRVTAQPVAMMGTLYGNAP